MFYEKCEDKIVPCVTKYRAMKTYGGLEVQGCIQKFPDWPPRARTTNCTALCH
jgi:hypothetical protein